jgi:hypothetical protein
MLVDELPPWLQVNVALPVVGVGVDCAVLVAVAVAVEAPGLVGVLVGAGAVGVGVRLAGVCVAALPQNVMAKPLALLALMVQP